MDAIAGLATMMHTDGKQWHLNAVTPLENVFNGDVHAIDFEGISERTMLRQRICRLIAEKLIEGVDSRLHTVLDLLEMQTMDLRDVNDNQLTAVNTILQILAHTVSSEGNPGVSVCAYIANHQRAIPILFDLIRLPSPNNSITNTNIKGLSIIILKNISKRMMLPFTSIVSCIKILFDSILDNNSNTTLYPIAMGFLSAILTSLSSCVSTDEDVEKITLESDQKMIIIDQISRFFISSKSISLISRIINNANINNNDGIMGSEFGYPSGRELDGVLDLLVGLCTNSSIFVDKIRTNIVNVSSDPDKAASLPALVCRLLQSKGKAVLSPIGVTSAFKFLSVVISTNATTGNNDDEESPNTNANTNSERSKEILMLTRSEGLVGLLALVCLPQHLELVSMWTLVTHTNTNANVNHDDNERGGLVDDLVAASSSILRSLTVIVATETSSKESQLLLESIHKTQMIKTLVLALKSFGASLSDGSLASIIYVLSELVLTSSKFMSQFSEAQGLEVIDDLPCEVFSSNNNLNDDMNTINTNQIEYRLCALQIASHLARHSEKHYALLSSVFSSSKLVSLLLYPNTKVRAKCCNLIGNLCRHNSKFYQALNSVVMIDRSMSSSSSSVSVLSLIIKYCGDNDTSIRKFACFAVGNAAFHSNELYEVTILSSILLILLSLLLF